MADIIKMNYPLMEEMALGFHQARETMDTSMVEMRQVAQLLADGALLGSAGQNFEQSVSTTLISTLQRLQYKFHELECDIQAAIQGMRGADSDVEGFVG
ncbi:MAG: hypothetical protein ACPG8W_23775 [Candidatus Promineifilaceae bacterium]